MTHVESIVRKLRYAQQAAGMPVGRPARIYLSSAIDEAQRLTYAEVRELVDLARRRGVLYLIQSFLPGHPL